jgi:outer membrane protein TolC
MRTLKMVWLALAIAATGPASPDVHAETTTSLSLGEAIQRALAGNADLRRERVAVAKAAALTLSAQGRFDLRIESSLVAERQACASTNCTDPAAGTTTGADVDLAVTRDLETGGNVRLAASANRLRYRLPLGYATEGDRPADVVDSFAYGTGLSLVFTHPLLRGFGSEIAQANLRKARIQQDIAQLGRQMRACNVLRDVIAAYWELAYATHDVAIKQSAVELAQEQLRITQAMIDAGRLAEADLASVERAIAQRQAELVAAEQNQYLRGLDLQRLFGVAPNPQAGPLAATDAPIAGQVAVDDDAEVTRALAANPQLRALRRGLALSDIDLATARSTLRPRLDFLGGIGIVGRHERLGVSLAQTARMDNVTGQAALVFELPVQNRTARGHMLAAEDDLDLARINAEDFALRLQDLVLRATRAIRTTVRRAQLGQREVEFAHLNLEAERARFHAGRATNNDVLLRQQELKDAEARLLRTTVDTLQTEVTLAALTAEVLDRHGVVLASP